jgi:CheY-like chemotaxis protein
MLPEPDRRPAPVSILIVEDEVLIRLLLADELRLAGFSVIEAANADEALAYVKSGGKVDLVFSDIEMPGAINGLALARELRERWPAIPVILTSGSVSSHAAESLGWFIAKPYTLERAVALVIETLGAKPAGAAP